MEFLFRLTTMAGSHECSLATGSASSEHVGTPVTDEQGLDGRHPHPSTGIKNHTWRRLPTAATFVRTVWTVTNQADVAARLPNFRVYLFVNGAQLRHWHDPACDT